MTPNGQEINEAEQNTVIFTGGPGVSQPGDSPGNITLKY